MAIVMQARSCGGLRRIAASGLGVGASVLLVGCGGGSGSAAAGSHGSSAGTRTAFVAQANAVCAQAVAKHAGHSFPVAGFDPEHPDPSQLPAVADYFAQYGGLATTTAGLHRLTPPNDDAAAWQGVLGVADRITANAQQQIAAGRARDVAGFVDAVHTANDLIPQLNQAASRLGFADDSACHQVFG